MERSVFAAAHVFPSGLRDDDLLDELKHMVINLLNIKIFIC